MSEEGYFGESESEVEVSGSDVPAPARSFDDLSLHSILNDNIRKCRFAVPTLVQKYAIPICLAARDLMACAQTGSGKTAAFCFPIIEGILREPVPGREGRRRVSIPLALILSPTRELAQQIADEAFKFCYQTGVRVGVVYGGTRLWSDNLGGVDILVATPGRLNDLLDREMVELRKLKYLTLDEADRMLDMGFEPQIRRIVEESGMPGAELRQTLMFSATFPKKIQRLAGEFLRKDYVFLAIGEVGSSTSRIEQEIIFVQRNQKHDCLGMVIDRQQMHGSKSNKTLVFVGTKLKADDLEIWLRSRGYVAIAIHGDKTQEERRRALKSFKSGSTPLLVATEVASRGIDIPDVSHVINFDLPTNIDDYVHRIGRTGRAGKRGFATALFCDGDAPLAHKLVHLLESCNQQVPDWLIQKAAESSTVTDRHERRMGSSWDAPKRSWMTNKHGRNSFYW
ncbi:DEAD-box ATP-dependent RNA helicase 52B [Selaginella moellendorffii]|uniref:DEAD-box ATP-dependent RNA helicase 52B n=1 Tax=Selaginella moellendorffii TaxID=88036 RepID=UPI000D1C8B85|nr:DEAD-box ATP-dependent RNA helicase 52B [Selaginella moellendorffii]|eukprot:XP_024543612.1 DEAD-box ATP-dependent RNA helicase 52B [Selaginella moellendorffii]